MGFDGELCDQCFSSLEDERMREDCLVCGLIPTETGEKFECILAC